jgi:stage II sporulation protein R
MLTKIIYWCKKECKILFLSLAFGTIFTLGLTTKVYSYNTLNSISREVLRFHVKANSNSVYDQKLKMAVKTGVLEYFEEELTSFKSVDEAHVFIQSNLYNIESVASSIVQYYGYDYTITAFMSTEFFPTKTYGSVSLPAGNYEALRINIGYYNGDNWWCVLFPPLCFVDISTSEFAKEEKEHFKTVLTQEQYNLIFMQDNGSLVPVQLRFKTVELWQNRNA